MPFRVHRLSRLKHQPLRICCLCLTELMNDAEPEIQELVLAQRRSKGQCSICGTTVDDCWSPSSRRRVTSLRHIIEFGPPHWDAFFLGCRCRDCHEATREMVDLLSD
jgi:ribosomal protein S27E